MAKNTSWVLAAWLASTLWGTASRAQADVWTKPFLILDMHTYTNGVIAVWGGSGLQLTDDRSVKDINAACTRDSAEMRIAPSADDHDKSRLLSMLMAAFLSGKRVQLYMSNAQCSDNRVTFWGVKILS